MRIEHGRILTYVAILHLVCETDPDSSTTTTSTFRLSSGIGQETLLHNQDLRAISDIVLQVLPIGTCTGVLVQVERWPLSTRK